MMELAHILAKTDSRRVMRARRQAFDEFLEDTTFERSRTPSWMEHMLTRYVCQEIPPSYYLAGEYALQGDPVSRMHAKRFLPYAHATMQTMREFSVYDASLLQVAQTLAVRQCGGMEWINAFEQCCVRSAHEHMHGLVESAYHGITRTFFCSMFAAEADSWRMMLEWQN